MARRKSGFLTQRNAALMSLIFLIPFLIMAGLLYFVPDWLNQIDKNVGTLIHELRMPHITHIATGVTMLGDLWFEVGMTIGVVLVLLTIREWQASMWYGITMVLGAYFLNDFVKHAFSRIRPDYISHLVEETSFSFPSGHSMGTMILFGGIAFLVTRYQSKALLLRWVVTFLCVGIVILVGLSRIYLGVHYPSDVIGGWSLGAAWLFLSIASFGIISTE